MNNYPTKKLAIYIFTIIVGTIFVAALFEFPEYSGQLSTLVLALTLGVLIWYTHDTHRIANESVMQTELQTRPIMNLYIRFVGGVKSEDEQKSIKEEYAITHQIESGIVPSPYYFALRNVGNGPAFNVSIESTNFIGWKYQTKFFAPKKDEHAVKIVAKPSNKIRSLSELKDEVFCVKCQTIAGKWYEYRYKIIDVEERIVEFVL